MPDPGVEPPTSGMPSGRSVGCSTSSTVSTARKASRRTQPHLLKSRARQPTVFNSGHVWCSLIPRQSHPAPPSPTSGMPSGRSVGCSTSSTVSTARKASRRTQPHLLKSRARQPTVFNSGHVWCLLIPRQSHPAPPSPTSGMPSGRSVGCSTSSTVSTARKASRRTQPHLLKSRARQPTVFNSGHVWCLLIPRQSHPAPPSPTSGMPSGRSVGCSTSSTVSTARKASRRTQPHLLKSRARQPTVFNSGHVWCLLIPRQSHPAPPSPTSGMPSGRSVGCSTSSTVSTARKASRRTQPHLLKSRARQPTVFNSGHVWCLLIPRQSHPAPPPWANTGVVERGVESTTGDLSV